MTLQLKIGARVKWWVVPFVYAVWLSSRLFRFDPRSDWLVDFIARRGMKFTHTHNNNG